MWQTLIYNFLLSSPSLKQLKINSIFVFLGGPNGSNGFTAVGLHATGGSQINNGQPLPIQSIKPIQAVQPQIHNTGIPIQQVSIAPNMTSSSHMMGSTAPPSGVIMNLNPRGGNGVSFTPQGRQGYAQMGHNSGSMDNISLNSTLSSNLSIGSSMSTGKFVLFFYLSRKFRNQVYQYILENFPHLF